MRHGLCLAAFLAASVILQGCAGIIEEARMEPQRPVVTVSPRVLDAAVRDVETLIDGDMLDAQEKSRARELIAAIEAFRHIPPDGGAALSARLERVLESSSGLVHRRLFRVEADETEKSSAGRAIIELHARILSAYISGDHRAVVDTADRIRETWGSDGLSPEATTVLALSLAAVGRRDEALRTGIDASRRLDGLPDAMILTSDLARWHAERGDTREASRSRERLAELLSERSLMLAALEERLAPTPPAEEDFKTWAGNLRRGRPELDGTLDSIEQAAEMVGEERFSDARDQLGRTRQWMEPIGGKTALIDEAMRRLEAAEELYLQKRMRILSRRDLDLAPISDLIARENYRDALTRLEAVERVAGSSPEIDEIREAAIERLITRETTRAAETFLAAGKTDDLKRKKTLLEETRSILIGLLSAYPAAASAGRIKSYVERVERELGKLGSGLGAPGKM